MLRIEGIPTRIVTGYVPAEINPLTGRVIIRRRDSHAWVEAWLPEQGRYVAFDPTPGRSREQVLGLVGPLGRVSALFSGTVSFIRRTWLRVMNDPAGAVGVLLRSPLTWIVLLMLTALWFRQRWFGRRTPETASMRRSLDPELHRIYQRYLRSLRRVGVVPLPAETDDELIERLSDRGDLERAKKARDFLAGYRRARYRGETIPEGLIELAQLK